MRSFRQRLDQFSRVKDPTNKKNLVVLRDIPDQDLISASTASINSTDQLDYIAVQYYGRGQESLWFEIADRNVREIVGFKCVFDYIHKINIPR